MSMPEASMYEYRDAILLQGDIGATSQPTGMQAKAQTHCVEKLPNA
jgi:hypothetical protein